MTDNTMARAKIASLQGRTYERSNADRTVTNTAIRGIMKDKGVTPKYKCSPTVYNGMRKLATIYLEKLVRNAALYATAAERKTVMLQDVAHAISRQ